MSPMNHEAHRVLGKDVAGLRIELRGTLERGNRARNVVGRLEVTTEHELRVRLAASRRGIG